MKDKFLRTRTFVKNRRSGIAIGASAVLGATVSYTFVSRKAIPIANFKFPAQIAQHLQDDVEAWYRIETNIGDFRLESMPIKK